MNGIINGLNSTLTDLGREIDVHKSIVNAARTDVEGAEAKLFDAQAALDRLIASEKEKRSEYNDFAQFLNGEPNRGTPAMRATLDNLNEELTSLVLQLSSARGTIIDCQKKYQSALGALDFNERRLEQKVVSVNWWKSI